MHLVDFETTLCDGYERYAVLLSMVGPETRLGEL